MQQQYKQDGANYSSDSLNSSHPLNPSHPVHSLHTNSSASLNYIYNLPLEIVEHVIKQLVATDATEAFKIVNGLNRFTRYSPFRKAILLDKANGFDMDFAAENGLVSLLDWWLYESGLEISQLSFSDKGLEGAVKNNHIPVLDWFYKNGLIKTCVVVDAANFYGSMEVLRWIKKRRLPLLCSRSPVDVAYERNMPKVMQWWINESEEPLTWSACPFDMYMNVSKAQNV